MTHTVCVPSSLVREAEDKREATRKLGYVARAAAVFRADRVVVFPDREGERRWGEEFVVAVLEYAATPPYLRREVWGKRDELEYVGVLPPLRVASQTATDSSESVALRQGIVTEVGPEGRVRVTCGLQHPISLRTPPGTEVSEGERVTVRISSREPVRARIVDEPPPGFAVERAGLPEALARTDAGVRIATSRHGRELGVSRLSGLVERIAEDGATVAFGAPGQGLPAMLGLPAERVADADAPETDSAGESATGAETVEPDPDADVDADAGTDPGFDLWLNTIPRQGSEVVRTEEAMFASLGCLTLRE